jgi:zinc transport system substrate-binding protein
MVVFMKRVLCAALCAALVLFAGASAEEDRLLVCASFYPMYDFTLKIGGERVDVVSLVPDGAEPHDWEPSPSDIVALERADVFVYNGAGMEHWVEDVLASLENEDLIAVESARGIELIEDAGHSHAEPGAHHGPDAHAHGDPHVWLNPIHAKAQMIRIKDALIQADPAGQSYYEANCAHWTAQLEALDQAFKSALTPLPNKDIVVAHQAFGYLCEAYGLNQVAIEGLTPDSEPDPARMAEIIDFAQSRAIKVIFFEEMVNPKVAQTIANAIGAATDVLSPIEGLSDAQRAAGADYFSVMGENLAALKAALE